MIWNDHDMGWWGYAGMGIGMVLFWALLILAIVALIRLITKPMHPSTATVPTPEQVLAERLARGEITESQYREKLAVLRDCPPQ
ncbi:membrane protein [Mycobacteroides abscessus subsp. massiliense]|nr:SHOCT domain-containing protein [Mycobacteroides abscessus]SKK91969.1 membrane protein [Mycobacteroides abscessus subsp. massiliense]